MTHDLLRRKRSLEDTVRTRTVAREAALARAERGNVAKVELPGKVSHELNTPIHQMLSALTLVQRNPGGEKAGRWLTTGIDAANHLHATVDRLLQVAALKSGDYVLEEQAFSANDVLDVAVAEAMPPTPEKTLEVRVAHLVGASSFVGGPAFAANGLERVCQ